MTWNLKRKKKNTRQIGWKLYLRNDLRTEKPLQILEAGFVDFYSLLNTDEFLVDEPVNQLVSGKVYPYKDVLLKFIKKFDDTKILIFDVDNLGVIQKRKPFDNIFNNIKTDKENYDNLKQDETIKETLDKLMEGINNVRK